AAVIDPLSQLLVDDEETKGGKRKRKTETGRITLPVPNKGEASAVGGGVEETVQPSPKKCKGSIVRKGRTMGLLTGPDASAGDLGGGDKNIPAADVVLGVVQSSSSQTAPAVTSSAAPFLWDPMFNPMEFIEKELNMVGDMSRFAATSVEDLQKKTLGHGLKSLLLNYLLSARQEQEVLEAKKKIEIVDKNLASIEKTYTATKDKLGKEIEDLKASHQSEISKLHKEHVDKLDQVKENYAAEVKKLEEDATARGELVFKLTKERDDAVSSLELLKQEKAGLEGYVNTLQESIALQYEDGFRYALEQVKVLFPDIDGERLGEADALNKIEDGKLVPYVPPPE
ncbi:hypothetical protein A2U01_0018719, partial [Trifolium medium]|nr:hypothetical protein [Trifolium medium]